MNKLILVKGVPRSGTSLMMRILEKGGIPCVYDDSKRTKESMSKFKNIYGFFEGGNIPKEGNVAVKRLGLDTSKLPYDCYSIFMYRHPLAILSSWEDVMGKKLNRNVKQIAENQAKIYNSLPKNFIVMNYDKIIQDTKSELLRLKKFLPMDFDVGKAEKAIDRKLYIKRKPMITETTLTVEEGFVVKTTKEKTPLEEYIAEKKEKLKAEENNGAEAQKNRDIILAELEALVSQTVPTE